MLNGAHTCTATQVIVDDSLVLTTSFEFCSFSYASRVCNKVVHVMAKCSLSLLRRCECGWRNTQLNFHPLSTLIRLSLIK